MRNPNLGATQTEAVLMMVGYFHQENIFDVPYNKNNSVAWYWSTLLFDDKFGSVLKCTGKPKVSVGGGEWTWLSPSLSFISTVI